MSNLSVAVITGGHSYDVCSFRDLFSEMSGVRAYVQHLEDFCSSPADSRHGYDVLVFYFMPDGVPSDDGPSYAGKQESVLKEVQVTKDLSHLI